MQIVKEPQLLVTMLDWNKISSLGHRLIPRLSPCACNLNHMESKWSVWRVKDVIGKVILIVYVCNQVQSVIFPHIRKLIVLDVYIGGKLAATQHNCASYKYIKYIP